MGKQKYTRINITLPENVKLMIEEYNKRSTWGDLNVSAVSSNAIADRIRATFPTLEKELFPLSYPEVTKTSDPGQPEISQKGKLEDKICTHCGKLFSSKTIKQKFCSNACKSANYRKIHK